MFKKTLVSITILILILALASVSALAQSGPAKGGKPTGTLPPDDPPIPTEVPDTGDLYGDLYVILRDVNGVPILREDVLVDPESGGDIVVSCIQPISLVTDSITIKTFDGELIIEAIADEPFSLASYIDLAGDLVECELAVVIDDNGTSEDPTDDIITDMATWVQAVDFGRLNLGRAPDAVIAHGLDEAINKLNLATDIKLDPAGRLVLALPDEATDDPLDIVEKTIDAPAENLALYVKMMLDGHWITDPTPVEPGGGGGKGGGGGPPPDDGPSTEPRPILGCFDEDGNATLLKENLDTLGYGGLCDDARTNIDMTNQELQLAASLLAAAADKTGTFTLDMVIYINSVYGINQAGSLPGEVEGKTYFDFGGFSYGRSGIYGNRSSGTCNPGWVWVLQPDNEDYIHFTAQCMDILGYDPDTNPSYNAVRFTDFVEEYEPPFINYLFDANIRGFAQSADDALRVIEYIHNYKIPENIYE